MLSKLAGFPALSRLEVKQSQRRITHMTEIVDQPVSARAQRQEVRPGEGADFFALFQLEKRFGSAASSGHLILLTAGGEDNPRTQRDWIAPLRRDAL